MTDLQKPFVVFLEDETVEWQWLIDLIQKISPDFHVESDPIPLAKWLHNKVRNESRFPKRVVFVVDVLILYADEIEDWKGVEWTVETSDGGLHFIDLFLRHEDSNYIDSPTCVVTQRRLDDSKIQETVEKIDARSPSRKNGKTAVFSKMIDSEVKEFVGWLENVTQVIKKRSVDD